MSRLDDDFRRMVLDGFTNVELGAAFPELGDKTVRRKAAALRKSEGVSYQDLRLKRLGKAAAHDDSAAVAECRNSAEAGSKALLRGYIAYARKYAPGSAVARLGA